MSMTLSILCLQCKHYIHRSVILITSAMVPQIARMSASSGSLSGLLISDFRPEVEKWVFLCMRNKISTKLSEIGYDKTGFVFIRHTKINPQRNSLIVRKKITRDIARFPCDSTAFLLMFVVIGLFFILPCTDSYTKVDLRTVSFDVPPQEV